MQSLDEIVDIFELLGDWEQRYQYLVELGDQLPPMPDSLMVGDNQVKACMSLVYVSAYKDPVDPDRIQFHGFCDTSVIRGVLALLIRLVSGKTLEEVCALDMDEVFERLNLAEHLSPNRHVGVYAIVELMKEKAKAVACSDTRGNSD